MTQTLVTLGRQPAIGLAEIESLYGAGTIQPLTGGNAALIDLPASEVTFERIGGCIKLAEVHGRIVTTQWPAIEKRLRSTAIDIASQAPDGKLKIGISVHGLSISLAKLGAIGLNLKKALRTVERTGSVRVVPNKELELNSAQVLHNGLATPTGIELLVVRDGASVIIARTLAVQDIDAYAKRDQGRPKRDARVGMLPPKLAQTIINLAGGPLQPQGTMLLDPFCGTGVVLQEAALMGFDVYGTDIEPRMIDYTAQNLGWLKAGYSVPATDPQLHTGDATNTSWTPAPAVVAAEAYLGQPFSSVPSAEKLAEVRNICNVILRKFLANAAKQLASGSRLCLAVPAWQTKAGTYQRLPLLSPTSDEPLDRLEELGYNRVSFKHVESSDLVYARADQIVGRELLVLIKK